MFKKLVTRSDVKEAIVRTSDLEWKSWLGTLRIFFAKDMISTLFGCSPRDPRPYLVIGVSGVACNALADSGATVSVMSEGALQAMLACNLDLVLQKSDNTIAVGNSNKLCVLGTVLLPISYNSVVKILEVHVCRDINVPLILGVDFLRSFDLCKDIFVTVVISLKL